MLIKRCKGVPSFEEHWQRLSGSVLELLFAIERHKQLSKLDKKRKRALFKLLQKGY